MCFLPVLKNKSQAVPGCPRQLPAELQTAAASWLSPFSHCPSHQDLLPQLDQTETSQEVTQRAACVFFIRPL